MCILTRVCFASSEDLDYDACLAKAQVIAGVSGARPAGKMQVWKCVYVVPPPCEERKLSRSG